MRGELTITVDKHDLLDKLTANRTQHSATYEKAKAGYIKVTMADMQEQIERLANGKVLDRIFFNSPPEDHTGDYDDAIAMMEWSTDDDIELTQGQFKQYVKDDWGWKDSWITSNTAYLEA